MSDDSTSGSSPSPDTRRDEALLALDRAHVAARDANGAELRRALEEARDLLRDASPSAVDRLSKAVSDLDTGALAEMETLLEDVRRELAGSR